MSPSRPPIPRRLPLAALCVVILSLGLAQLPAAPWSDLTTDLPPNPALLQGTLPNGLRYAILPNSTPANRISLRLLVSVGSLHERDDERGLAHFVEHMLFRGTRLHPADSLVSALQRLGVGLGPDNTAFTSFDHTIYHLELPDTGETSLRQGLEVFREYAEGATFDPAFIERERGVILSEKATRDTPGLRQGAANIAFLWPDARHARRPIVGIVDTIRNVTRDQFVSFYDAWYRPERMAVIIVGNTSPETAARLVNEVFSPLAARGPARDEPADTTPATAAPPNVLIHQDPGMFGVNLTFQHPQPYPHLPDTRDRRVQALHRSLAFTMFQQRLNRIAQESGDNLVAPAVSISQPLPGWQITAFSANARISNWQPLAASVEQEHRRAMLHGFSATELNLARTTLSEALETAVRAAPTRPSEQLSAELVATLLHGRPISTALAIQQDMADPLATATVSDCTSAFRTAWDRSPLHVFVNANPSAQITASMVATLLNDSRRHAAHPRADSTATTFAYTDFGPPGQVAREEFIADLDTRISTLSNGVKLNFKPTAFDADSVEIRLRVGAGKLTVPKDRPGLDLLASLAFVGGGLGRHGSAEIANLFAGRRLAVWFNIEPDCMAFTAHCSRRDLLPCLQLLAAYLTDPGYRPEALRDARASYGTILSNSQSSPGAPIRHFAERFLLKNDPRFGLPLPAEFYQRTIEEMKPWVAAELKNGAIEMSVVGDTSWEETVAAVNHTLGALPPRPARTPVTKTLLPTFAKAPDKPTTFIVTQQLKQSAIAWLWPVPDPINIQQERRSRLLADAIAERMRLRLRTELGSAYAPTAHFVSYRGLPSSSYFIVYAEVDALRTDEAAKVVRDELERLRAKGFTDDEFERAKQPFLRSRQDDLRHNSYWGHTVLGDVQEHPERLAAARDRASDTAAITRAEIEKLLRNYMKPSKGFPFVSRPGTVRYIPNR